MSVSATTYYGGGLYQSFAADITISAGNGKNRTLVATGAGLKVKIEALTRWHYFPTRRIFNIWNAGANAFTITDSAGTTIKAVPAGDIATVDIYSTSGVGSFGARTRTPV